MLLVHDYHAQFGELDSLLDQGMGSDHQLRLAARDGSAVGPLAIFIERARQQHHSVGLLRPLQQLARAQKVLRGQNFRGRHQCCLVAVLDGNQHGLQGHDGLSRPHVALQQPSHGFRGPHVCHNLAQRRLLRLGGVERQHLAQRRAYRFIGLKRNALPLAKFLPLQLQA